MFSLRMRFQPAVPVSEQVVYAVKKALVTGALAPGDGFPSVRRLSRELGINPNTAHKVVAALATEGVLEVRPGTGSVVAAARHSSTRQRERLLGGEVERLVVEAHKLGLAERDLTDAVRQHWRRLARGHVQSKERRPASSRKHESDNPDSGGGCGRGRGARDGDLLVLAPE
jgi:GntR family transcriptional regulator